jgi:glycosyltransferase involved in cell wall biosynthesis
MLTDTRNPVILLNLLAVTDGGQVTRAQAFLSRYREYEPLSKLVILRREGTLSFCDKVDNALLLDVAIGDTFLRPWLRLVWENINLRTVIKRVKPDAYLTFSHYLPSSIKSNILSVVGVTNLAPFSPKAMASENMLMKLKMSILKIGIISSAKRADQVIALSIKCSQYLEKSGVDASTISVVPNGVELIKPSSTCGSLHQDEFGEASKYLLYVSSFFRYKNFDLLVKSYASLPLEIKEQYKLILIGGIRDESYYQSIKQSAERLNVADKVILIPGLERDQLAWYYQNAAIFIFPSLIENCPNILLEALSFGLPILCSKEEPMPEFGGDAVDYFDPYSEAALTESIKNLLLDRDRMKTLSVKARQRSTEYSWDSFTRKVAALLRVGDKGIIDIKKTEDVLE